MRKLRILALLFFSLFLFACASTDDKVSEVTPEVPEVTDQVNTEETENETSAENENSENLNETTSEEENSETEDASEVPEFEYEELEEIEEPEVQDLPLEEPVITEEVIEISEPEIELPVEPITEEEIEELPAIEETAETENQTDTDINFDEIPTEGTGNPDISSDIIRWTEGDNEETEDEDTSAPEMTETEETTAGTEEQNEIESEENEEPEEEIIIVPSRTVTMNKGETLVVVYPGNGWIYMGSLSEYNNLASKGRKLGATDTKYTLLAKDSGTQIHHFFKEDNLTGEYIDDYLEVVVTTKKSNSKVTVTAPDYSEIVPERPAKSEAKKYYESLEASENKPESKPKASSAKTENKSEKEDTASISDTSAKTTSAETKKEPEVEKTKTEESTSFYIQPAENELEQMDEVLEVNNNNDDDIMFIDDEIDIDTDALLDEATSAYENKDYSKAIDQLNQFFEHAESRRDEALFLKGQILEQDSYLKDIKGAVNAYQTLLDNYPASSYWNKANKRIIYLKRFYIEVR